MEPVGEEGREPEAQLPGEAQSQGSCPTPQPGKETPDFYGQMINKGKQPAGGLRFDFYQMGEICESLGFIRLTPQEAGSDLF